MRMLPGDVSYSFLSVANSTCFIPSIPSIVLEVEQHPSNTMKMKIISKPEEPTCEEEFEQIREKLAVVDPVESSEVVRQQKLQVRFRERTAGLGVERDYVLGIREKLIKITNSEKKLQAVRANSREKLHATRVTKPDRREHHQIAVLLKKLLIHRVVLVDLDHINKC